MALISQGLCLKILKAYTFRNKKYGNNLFIEFY